MAGPGVPLATFAAGQWEEPASALAAGGLTPYTVPALTGEGCI